MKNSRILLVFILAIMMVLRWADANANAAIHIVAAENFYGEVTQQLGGPYVSVDNILTNPNEDPHLFSINPTIATKIADANIIIYNGADYDPWIINLIPFKNQKQQDVIVVADLIGFKSGSNPHIWYQPEIMLAFAKKITAILIKNDPLHQAYFEKHYKKFVDDYQAITRTIKHLQSQFNTVPIIATEPIFNYMASSIGLTMHGERFQLSVMNDVAPSIAEVEQFESDLRQHKVRAMIFNVQVINPMTARMLGIAKQEKIPVIGVSETLPQGMTYIQWMLSQLQELEQALQKNPGHSYAK